MGAKESVGSAITLSDNIIDKANDEINDADTSKLDESIKDVDDTISTSSDTDIACNDTSVSSISDTKKLENITPPPKKLTPQQILRKQESAKKNEERQRIKQVNCLYALLSRQEITLYLKFFFFYLFNNINP